MADTKISALAPATTPLDGTDYFVVVQDVLGTPVSRRVAASDVLTDPTQLVDLDVGEGTQAQVTVSAGTGAIISALALGGDETNHTAQISVAANDGQDPEVLLAAGEFALIGTDSFFVHGRLDLSGPTPQLGFFGATPVPRPTIDPSDTDTNRIAALETALLDLGLVLDPP